MSGLSPDPNLSVPFLLPQQDTAPPIDDSLDDYEQSLRSPLATAESLIVSESPPMPVGRSWGIDLGSGLFVTGRTGGGPLGTSGVATLKTLISKALVTARGAHPIYDDDYGIDLPADFFGGPVTQFPTDVYAEAIREACKSAHERVVDVIDIQTTFDPSSEAIFAAFTVILDQGETLTLNDMAVGRA